MARPLSGCVLDHLLYQGSEVEVWCAHLEGHAEPVAIKRAVDPQDASTARRLLVEAASADPGRRAGRHPDLLVPIGVLADPPAVAVVYPYLAGGTVRSLLERRGALSPGELVALLTPVAAALAAWSETIAEPDDDVTAGAVDGGPVVRGGHGDLKPDNLLLRSDGTPVVADVGAAGRGTPAYVDPAVSAGAVPSPRSDVFSLGVIIYEALTGRRPHRGAPAEVVALAAAGAHRDLGTWPGVPAEVAAVVESALASDPSSRPPTPTDLVDALRSVVDPTTVVLPGPAPIERTVVARPDDVTIEFGPRPPSPVAQDRPSRLRPLAVALAGAAALAGGVAVLGPLQDGWPTVGGGAGDRTTQAASSLRCPVVDPGDGQVAVDLDGDGCDEPASWDGAVLVAASGHGAAVRLRVGGPGLSVLFGDWDGDGATTVAAYDPVVGVVRYLDRLDQPDDERVEPVARGGRATVVPADTADPADQVVGDRVVVEPP